MESLKILLQDKVKIISCGKYVEDIIGYISDIATLKVTGIMLLSVYLHLLNMGETDFLFCV
jgi:hypothetical protein